MQKGNDDYLHSVWKCFEKFNKFINIDFVGQLET